MTDKRELTADDFARAPVRAAAKKRVPWVTVVLMGLSISFMIAWGLFDWDGGDGTLASVPMLLGVAGAVWALCCRSMDLGDRVGWAVLSFMSWIVLVGGIFFIGTLLWGP